MRALVFARCILNNIPANSDQLERKRERQTKRKGVQQNWNQSYLVWSPKTDFQTAKRKTEKSQHSHYSISWLCAFPFVECMRFSPLYSLLNFSIYIGASLHGAFCNPPLCAPCWTLEDCVNRVLWLEWMCAVWPGIVDWKKKPFAFSNKHVSIKLNNINSHHIGIEQNWLFSLNSLIICPTITI